MQWEFTNPELNNCKYSHLSAEVEGVFCTYPIHYLQEKKKVRPHECKPLVPSNTHQEEIFI